MTDTQKLKALAEAAPTGPWYPPEETSHKGMVFDCDLGSLLRYESIDTERDACVQYVAAANPAAVLELISEIERIAGENQRLRAGVESDLAEIDRIQAVYDAHFRKTRSYRMQRDQAKDESDQLKAENTDLHATLQAAKGEIERLKGEIEALQKDAERYRWLRMFTIKGVSLNVAGALESLDRQIDHLSKGASHD